MTTTRPGLVARDLQAADIVGIHVRGAFRMRLAESWPVVLIALAWIAGLGWLVSQTIRRIF